MRRDLVATPRLMKADRHSTVLMCRLFLPFILCAIAAGCSGSTEHAESDTSIVAPGQGFGLLSSEAPDLQLSLRLVNANPGYVGVDQCAECHRERCEEFRGTRHFVACVVPDAGRMPPGFDGQPQVIRSHLPEATFRMSHRGNEYFVELTRSAEHSGLSQRDENSLRIALAYGVGGTADEVYFAWQGNQLRELPVGWLHPQHGWGAQQFSSPDDPGNYSRVATTRCLECHNTWFEHTKGTANEYRPDSFLTGVTCERCHGPGEAHVRHHQTHRDDKVAAAVVHPGKLSRDRLLDVCAQCHSSGIFRKTDLFSFRPGDDLSDHFREHQNPHFEDDHVANQVKYLKQSGCFQNSSTLSCVTCHSPHQATSAAVQGIESCRTCHQPADCVERPRLPADVQDQCATCHMPKYGRLAVRFHVPEDRYVFPVRATQHRIAVYPEARDEALLAWYERQEDADSRQKADQLRTSLTEWWQKKAADYQSQYRLMAAIGALREACRFDWTMESPTRLQAVIQTQTELDRQFAEVLRLQAQERYAEAIEILRAMLKVKPDLAMAHAKLGTFLAVLGRQDEAMASLQESARLDPDNSYGDNMLGWLAYLRGDADEAVAAFRRAEDIYPWTAENNYRWGLALMQQQNLDEAGQRLRHALEIAPNDPATCRSLAQVLQKQGNPQEALKYVYRAAELTKFRDADVLLELCDGYRASGHPIDAIATARQALALPGVSGSDTGSELRSRLENLSGL